MDSDAPAHSPLSAADVLARAADLIEPEGRWTQGESARTSTGDGLVDALADEAVCWCAAGAVSRAAGETGDMYGNAMRALSDYLKLRSYPLITEWNDNLGRTQAEVVAALRSAAALARDGSGTQKDNPQGES
jgi:hypothetical protein